jgi:hypothetical protein
MAWTRVNLIFIMKIHVQYLYFLNLKSFLTK